MKLIVTDHAITRYWERVKPQLLRRQAHAELQELVAEVEALEEAPRWLRDRRVGERYVSLGDGIAAAVDGDRVTTVMTRASRSAAHRARKREERRRRRYARHGGHREVA